MYFPKSMFFDRPSFSNPVASVVSCVSWICQFYHFHRLLSVTITLFQPQNSAAPEHPPTADCCYYILAAFSDSRTFSDFSCSPFFSVFIF